MYNIMHTEGYNVRASESYWPIADRSGLKQQQSIKNVLNYIRYKNNSIHSVLRTSCSIVYFYRYTLLSLLHNGSKNRLVLTRIVRLRLQPPAMVSSGE